MCINGLPKVASVTESLVTGHGRSDRSWMQTGSGRTMTSGLSRHLTASFQETIRDVLALFVLPKKDNEPSVSSKLHFQLVVIPYVNSFYDALKFSFLLFDIQLSKVFEE